MHLRHPVHVHKMLICIHVILIFTCHVDTYICDIDVCTHVRVMLFTSHVYISASYVYL